MILIVSTSAAESACLITMYARTPVIVTKTAESARANAGRKMMENRRELDGVYFRIKRDGKWDNICFTDLTKEERDKVCENRSAEWFKDLEYHLADRIQYIGEIFDIVAEG